MIFYIFVGIVVGALHAYLYEKESPGKTAEHQSWNIAGFIIAKILIALLWPYYLYHLIKDLLK